MTLGQEAVGRHGANQDEWELDRTVELIRPWLQGGCIVEIGCDRGGTLWLWRQLASEVVGITLHTRKDGSFNAHGARVVTGDTTEALYRCQVEDCIYGLTCDLVFVDGGHDYDTALSDIRWALEICPAGLVVVHDINRNLRHPEIETYIAWAEVADDRPHMTIARYGSGSPGTGILFPKSSRDA